MPARLILLVNHDASIGEVLRVCLRYLAGWDVISIGSEQFHIDMTIVKRPDAILVDALLPQIYPLGFIQRLLIKKLKKNQLTQSVPILLITDGAGWFTPEQLSALGITGAIAKPFDPTTLPTQIAQMLGWEPDAVQINTQ